MTDESRRNRALQRRLDKKMREDAIQREIGLKAEDVFKSKIGPIMGGLITDPIPAKVRKLEERVTALETFALKMLQYMDSQNAK